MYRKKSLVPLILLCLFLAGCGIKTDKIKITVDVAREVRPISPLIYGVSGANKAYLQKLHLPFNSWGGNANTRYNWRLGNAWSAGRDYEYRNGDYGYKGTEPASDLFLRQRLEQGVATRLLVPTMGWVAKDNNLDNCAFPQPDGSCGYANNGTCENPTEVADPTKTSVPYSAEDTREWMVYLQQRSLQPSIIGLDNEPELWGITHYDVHPTCPTYDEIIEKFIAHGEAVRAVFPKIEIAGPMTCCWYYYWNAAAGREDKLAHNNQDYLPWFLDQMYEYERKTGVRLLDVFDLHFYPQGLFDNPDTSSNVLAHRLRASRSLWDKNYEDESWIRRPIYLIPRMKELIEAHYPGLKLGISEWNFGQETTLNGALAIADVLGVFGKQELYYANYWTHPPVDSAGYYAFKLFTNYDDNGGKFGDLSVSAESDHDLVSSYASVDSKTGALHLILVNKSTQRTMKTTVELSNYSADANVDLYRYGQDSDSITHQIFAPRDKNLIVELPPYSISHFVWQSR